MQGRGARAARFRPKASELPGCAGTCRGRSGFPGSGAPKLPCAEPARAPSPLRRGDPARAGRPRVLQPRGPRRAGGGRQQGARGARPPSWPWRGDGVPGPTHPGAARGRAAGGCAGPGPWRALQGMSLREARAGGGGPAHCGSGRGSATRRQRRGRAGTCRRAGGGWTSERLAARTGTGKGCAPRGVSGILPRGRTIGLGGRPGATTRAPALLPCCRMDHFIAREVLSDRAFRSQTEHHPVLQPLLPLGSVLEKAKTTLPRLLPQGAGTGDPVGTN